MHICIWYKYNRCYTKDKARAINYFACLSGIEFRFDFLSACQSRHVAANNVFILLIVSSGGAARRLSGKVPNCRAVEFIAATLTNWLFRVQSDFRRKMAVSNFLYVRENRFYMFRTWRFGHFLFGKTRK